MLKRVLVGIIAIVVVLAAIVAMQPADFRIARTTTVAALPAAVFAEVNDLRRWQAWSPWEKVDPGMRRAYGGALAGMGATYAWNGNADVGEGRMTITESRPNERIRLRLEFLKPFAATHAAEFTFEPRDGETVVTWSMAGNNGFTGKAIGLMMDMDEMVGGQFEKGLADMKRVAEAGSATVRAGEQS